MDLKNHIRSIPDYPKPGILFYDIGTLLANGQAWRETVRLMSEIVAPLKPDLLVGIESRGFLVGAAVAAHLGLGFAMVRKKGKLPGETLSLAYDLEYGQDVIEMQKGVLKQGDKVVLCDDLLATGGTASAALSLIRKQGAEVLRAAFVIELDFLRGRTRLDVETSSLVRYNQ
ncbi:MAG: adenine phosphoribosyltransferase [Alphaproteobacteria bacterium]|nr:adenine phosphoribosyltransferase [Alphaproteobacteria bacterium]